MRRGGMGWAVGSLSSSQDGALQRRAADLVRARDVAGLVAMVRDEGLNVDEPLADNRTLLNLAVLGGDLEVTVSLHSPSICCRASSLVAAFLFIAIALFEFLTVCVSLVTYAGCASGDVRECYPRGGQRRRHPGHACAGG